MKNLADRRSKRYALLYCAALFCSIMGMRCTPPEDPAQNPENVVLTVLTSGGAGDSVTIGDSLTFKLAAVNSALVDSLRVSIGDSTVLTLRECTDTMTIALLPGACGDLTLAITGYCINEVVKKTEYAFFIRSMPILVTTQPQSDTVGEGNSVLFIAAATGKPLPAIQWFRDSVAISGATNDTLRIDSATVSLGGSMFRARFVNSVETVWSDGATLQVTGTPSRWDALVWDRAVWQ